MTMNGELLQRLMNPLPQKKMAGLEGTIGSLATAEDLHRFPNSQLPQYGGTYFTCEPRLPDGDNLPPFWGPPNRSLLNGRNALIHSPREKGSPPNHVVYAADNQQFPTEGNHASPAQDLPEKQGFSYYPKSPETRRIMTPGGGTTGSVRKHPVGSGNASPTSGNSICLAFPKPIYGHSPCCSELGCTARPRYRVEPGEQRVDPNVFEEDWVLYSHRALLHGSNPAFLHQRPTQLERSADRLPLRDVAADQFLNLSQNEKRKLPAFTESNYISYPCTPTRPLVAPSIEPCQRLQIPSKAFHGLYPSHGPTYKHMTSVHLASSSQLYQNPSPMSTYGQLTQQQLVYYPQANVEAQSGVAYKDVGGKYKADVNPSVHRNSPPNPLAHYLVSQPRFSDVPLIMTPPPSHSFLRGYEHSSNPVYRMNLTSDQMRSTIDKLCAPPPAMQMGRFCAPPHSLHMDRPTSHSHSIQGDHPRVPQPNLHMNRPCAPPHSQKVDQPIATSYRLLMDRPKPPPQSQHMDRSGVPATNPQPEQALDYSKYRGTSPRQAQDHPEAGRALLTRQLSDGRGHPHHTSAGIYNTDAQTVTGSPAFCSYGNPVPRSNTDFKNLKRHLSDAPLNNQPINQQSTPLDDREVAVEICPPKKRVKMETEESRASSCQLQASFPMPVINNVFSLAPYKAFIEAEQILSSVQSSPKVEEPQHCVVKAEPCDQEDDHHPGEIPVVSSASAEVKPAVLLDSSKEEPVVKMIELTKIKREPQDSDQILEEVKHEGSLHIPVKNELLEKDSPVSGLMLVIKKCDPDELESKSFKSANDVLSLEKVVDPLVEQEKVRPSIHSSPQWTIWPKPATPSQSSDGKSDLQKIPPQSLNLSAYKMILPERLKAAPPTPKAPEKLLPPAQTAQGAEDPRPARQHFMELHQALCRLLSKSVTQFPKQELRDWLCKLEHTGPSNPSAKAQNLPGLLGAEARELWLSNVEIRCSLQKVLQRLKEYISQHHCPFPHVKRAGAVFIPMLVLKEILFPQVQGIFINQVLQEHKVELRPTTLSEEKTLTQLHKRACSSKLRRLLSLKNLPEIYLDVLNLLYHSCVCKHMGAGHPSCLFCMVMTCRHIPSTALLTLLVLLTVSPQLAGAAAVGVERAGGRVEGLTRTDPKEDSHSPLHTPPVLTLPRTLSTVPLEQGQGPPTDMDPAQRLASVLLEALDHPGAAGTPGRPEEEDSAEGQRQEPSHLEARGNQEGTRVGNVEEKRWGLGEESSVLDKRMDRLRSALDAAAQGEELREREEEEDQRKISQEERGRPMEDEAARDGGGSEEGGERDEEEVEGRERPERFGFAADNVESLLQRKTRGYFQNIDLGLQDNEILPPLKGYKAYNTQLARAGKKLHWQEEQARNRPIKGSNFMDDFENEGEEEVEEEVESLTRVEEEARARADKQEVLRQQEEAERAREEEQRLADIASDMLLQYMGRKQQGAPYLEPRQKSSLAAAGNAAEDKRSEEVAADDDDLDQQMIDRLIEISSKLHLPADDVVEIISDVEEKKKKRKDLPPPSNPVAPRFRPLVPPPLAGPPIYHYTASSNPKKAPYKTNKKWQKDKNKAKSYKQEYWYKPQKQVDYWYKPQKQFLAFPSYPYYQKPYRAYYPVYFPYPKASGYYEKTSLPRDQQLFVPQDYGFQPPRRRHRAGVKARGQGWRQQPPPRLPATPYISNYILPHPRTYQPLPPPKPRSPSGRGRQPPFYYPPALGDDYEEDGLEPQLDSDEELENFIERIYMKRRMY